MMVNIIFLLRDFLKTLKERIKAKLKKQLSAPMHLMTEGSCFDGGPVPKTRQQLQEEQ